MEEFIRAHMEVLAGMDFFTVEVFTWSGLAKYYVLFLLHLESRRITVAGAMCYTIATRSPAPPLNQS